MVLMAIDTSPSTGWIESPTISHSYSATTIPADIFVSLWVHEVYYKSNLVARLNLKSPSGGPTNTAALFKGLFSKAVKRGLKRMLIRFAV